MSSIKFVISALLMVVLVSACQTTHLVYKGYQPSAAMSLKSVANSVSQSLQALENTQQAANPPQVISAPIPAASYGMQILVDVNWDGPIEPLVAKLSSMVDYKLRVLGTSPAIPIIISIHSNKVTIAQVLKNAGLQSKKRAAIVVYPTIRVVELRYHGDR